MKEVADTCYLIVEPVLSRYVKDEDGLPRVDGCQVRRMTKKPPSFLENGQVAVRIKLRLPAQAFKPLTPSAEVVVPAEMIQNTVEVEAVAP